MPCVPEKRFINNQQRNDTLKSDHTDLLSDWGITFYPISSNRQPHIVRRLLLHCLLFSEQPQLGTHHPVSKIGAQDLLRNRLKLVKLYKKNRSKHAAVFSNISPDELFGDHLKRTPLTRSRALEAEHWKPNETKSTDILDANHSDHRFQLLSSLFFFLPLPFFP